MKPVIPKTEQIASTQLRKAIYGVAPKFTAPPAILAALLLAGSWAGNALAADTIWTRSAGSAGNWSDAANWSGGIPTAGFNAVFTNTTAADDPNEIYTLTMDKITFAGSSSVSHSLQFGGGSGGWNVNAAGTFIEVQSGNTAAQYVNASRSGGQPIVLQPGTSTILNNGSGGLTVGSWNISVGMGLKCALNANSTLVVDGLGNTTLGGFSGGTYLIADNGSGTLSLSKTGAGALTLNTANTYSGGTTLLGTGTLNLANPTAAGTGPIYLQSAQTSFPVTFGISGGITVTNAIQIDSNTGRETIGSTGTGNNALTGGITITGAGTKFMQLGNNQTSGTLTLSGGISGAGGFTLGGNLAGDVGIFNGVINLPAGGLGNNGAANWTLNTAGSVVLANQQYSGGITIQSSGGFNLGVANALPSAPLNFSQAATGKVNLNGYDQTLAGVQTYLPLSTGNGGIITNGSATSDATLTLSGLPGNMNFPGSIKDGSRKVALVMNNSAAKTQTLSGTNTYSGGTTLRGIGTLVLGSSAAAGTGPIYLQSAQTSYPTTLGLIGGITVTNPVQIDSISGRENIESTGTGNTALTGGITITNGGNKFMAINQDQTSGTLTVSGGITGTNGFNGGFALRGNLAGDVGVFNGVVNTPSSYFANSGGPNWTLNTAGSSYTTTYISSSGSFHLGVANALATGAPVSFGAASTGQLNLNGYYQSVAGLTSDPITTGNGGIVINNSVTSGATLTLSGLTTNYTYLGVIQDGPTMTVSLVMNSAGRTQTLNNANTYTGNTTISAGTLALGASGSIANSTNIIVASNAVFNVSALPSPFTLASSQTLSNSAPGAIINGANDCSAGTVSLVYNGVNPSFTITNGGMTFAASTTFHVRNTGAALGNGSYKLIAAGMGGSVGGTVPSSVSVNPGGLGTGGTAALAISGSELYLNVTGASTVNTNSPVLTNSISGGSLTLSWPADHLGWYLQAQTNALYKGLSTNWVTVPGSQLVTTTNLPVIPANPSVFYRLVYTNTP